MYQSELAVWLIGFDEQVEKIWRSVTPLRNFVHVFPKEGEQASKMAVRVAVLAKGAGLSPLAVRQRYGTETKLIYCTDEPEALTDDEMAVITDIWPLTASPRLWWFYIERLQRNVSEERNRYFFENCLHTAINMLPDLIWFKDVKGSHLKVNDAFCECVAKEKSDVEGRGHYYIWGLTEEMYKKGEFVCLETEQAVLEKRCTCVFDEQVQDQNGKLRELKTWKAPLFDRDGEELIGTVGIARDVTVENEQRRKIESMAYSDSLTGVANRAAFYRYIDAERKGQPVTVLYIDADNFKQVNDTYGHKAGDEALICIVSVLKAHFGGDFITRLGGDEFLVTILGPLDREVLRTRLDKFMEDMLETFSKNPMFGQLSVSVGVAGTDDAKVSINTVMHNGDAALYAAKWIGRRRYVFFDESSELMREVQADKEKFSNSLSDWGSRSTWNTAGGQWQDVVSDGDKRPAGK